MTFGKVNWSFSRTFYDRKGSRALLKPCALTSCHWGRYGGLAIWLFLTQDPIGLAGGVNLYAYAGNNPISYDDPFGLCPPADEDDGPWCHSPLYWLLTHVGVSSQTATNVTQVGYNAAMMAGGVNLTWETPSGLFKDTEGNESALGLTSKDAARGALKEMGVEGDQAASANRAIGRATKSEKIDVLREAGGNVKVRLTRPGKNGYQTVESTIKPDGSKTVVQYGVNAQGQVEHVDPKN